MISPVDCAHHGACDQAGNTQKRPDYHAIVMWAHGEKGIVLMRSVAERVTTSGADCDADQRMGQHAHASARAQLERGHVAERDDPLSSLEIQNHRIPPHLGDAGDAFLEAEVRRSHAHPGPGSYGPALRLSVKRQQQSEGDYT